MGTSQRSESQTRAAGGLGMEWREGQSSLERGGQGNSDDVLFLGGDLDYTGVCI